jgi:hypothetical protein
VPVAFALGWQMAELFRPNPDEPASGGSSGIDLPGIGALAREERRALGVQQVAVALAKLSARVSAVGQELPDASELRVPEHKPATDEERRDRVLECHKKLLRTLTAADFRLGKAYGLGRALADTTRGPVTLDSLKVRFGHWRIEQLCGSLLDLSTAFPPHAAHAVVSSMQRWREYVADEKDEKPWVQARSEHRRRLRRQGERWRTLLSAERLATQTLTIDQYVGAGRKLFARTRRLLWTVLWRSFPWLLPVVGLVGAAGWYALAHWHRTGGVIASLAAAAGALGVTWKGIGSSLGAAVGQLERPLWGAEVDEAVAEALTKLPEPDASGLRRILPGGHQAPPSDDPVPARERETPSYA